VAQRPVAAPGQPGQAGFPERALIVSASIGEGHNASGRALEQAIRRAWPGCEVRWLDTLAAMGPGIGPIARACYVLQVQHLPWLYEVIFRAIWHRWFLSATRRLIGAWCGRRIGARIREYEPDVIISTYPLGSAGLSWLRRRRGLPVPVGAWVTDFCPHPYWVYPELDITFVMHQRAAELARSLEPGARVAVGGLPVPEAFRPADRAAARARLGLDTGRTLVVVSMGSLGFGAAGRAVAAALAAGPEIEVVAVCGRNGRLRARLSRQARHRGRPAASRLRVLGWTDRMQDWLAAADLVVTNAGGVTVLEAMACARPVIMFRPIAGHGRANASLLSEAGLAVVCRSPADLTRAVRRLPESLRGPACAAPPPARRPEDDLADLVSAGRPAPLTSRPDAAGG
jgi:UDP-N-acetylglucosamine:LPS N-acetylglucosamine transferase